MIRLNEQLLPWQPGLSVAELLSRQGLDGQALATAVNGNFLPRGQRQHSALQPGDVVTLFKAIVGG